ncbi:MAG: hypothetical protein PVH63_06165 [Balneolaceae bacterium]|jgi:hypothetical protein
MYQIFFWVHTISYISWLLAFIVSVFFAVKVRREQDAIKKRKYMRSERLATSIGAHIGALGILISGGAMASLTRPGGWKWGWFNFQEHAWLGVKQIIFFIILILVAFSIKRSVAFKKKLKKEEDVLSSGTSEKWASAYRLSLLVYLLVVVNTFLGLVRPF